MPFDGFGAFIRVRNWVADATAGVKIRADFHDTEDDGFAQGLGQCIVKDGQSTITQNIPFNSKRVTALADPINPQDAATKAYADTKVPLAGGTPLTGDLVIKKDDPVITLNGTAGHYNVIYGDKTDKHRWGLMLGDATAETGSNAGSNFDLNAYADDGTLLSTALFGTRSTGLLTVKGDPTAALGIATKQYSDGKLPLAGGTITGSLTVNGNLRTNGELLAAQGFLRFLTSGGAGYIQWNGGSDYYLGGGGTIWHSGNFHPVGTYSDARMIVAGDYATSGSLEPVFGGIVTSVSGGTQRIRYLQLYADLPGQIWHTVGYYP